MERSKPVSVDEYLSSIDWPEARDALVKLRETILDEIPEAQEVISYGIPTYKLHGMVCSIAAFSQHCSFFPGHTVKDFTEQLQGFKTSKGTIQFHPAHPLPEQLVREIVRARANENEAKQRGKY